MADETKDLDQALEAVRRALDNLKFGAIEITVHEGKIVQIERKEKVRLHGTTKRNG